MVTGSHYDNYKISTQTVFKFQAVSDANVRRALEIVHLSDQIKNIQSTYKGSNDVCTYVRVSQMTQCVRVFCKDIKTFFFLLLLLILPILSLLPLLLFPLFFFLLYFLLLIYFYFLQQIISLILHGEIQRLLIQRNLPARKYVLGCR